MTGPEFAAWRKTRGISLARLAEITHEHISTVTRWQRRAAVPSLLVLAMPEIERRAKEHAS
jgi:transcriptional regulator with XRE-family HTH domain